MLRLRVPVGEAQGGGCISGRTFCKGRERAGGGDPGGREATWEAGAEAGLGAEVPAPAATERGRSAPHLDITDPHSRWHRFTIKHLLGGAAKTCARRE